MGSRVTVQDHQAAKVSPVLAPSITPIFAGPASFVHANSVHKIIQDSVAYTDKHENILNLIQFLIIFISRDLEEKNPILWLSTDIF